MEQMTCHEFYVQRLKHIKTTVDMHRDDIRHAYSAIQRVSTEWMEYGTHHKQSAGCNAAKIQQELDIIRESVIAIQHLESESDSIFDFLNY